MQVESEVNSAMSRMTGPEQFQICHQSEELYNVRRTMLRYHTMMHTYNYNLIPLHRTLTAPSPLALRPCEWQQCRL